MAAHWNNRVQAHQTREDRADRLLDSRQLDKAAAAGFDRTFAGVRAYLKARAAAERRAKRRIQQARRDAAFLVAQHVNTAEPPPVYHPGQNICRGYYPRVAKLVVIDAATAHAIAQCRALVAEMKGWKAA